MALLLADENFPAPAVERLRQLGYDVLTLLQTNMAGLAIPDDEVLAFATSLNRCLLTLNRKDFIKLHTQSANMPVLLSAHLTMILMLLLSGLIIV